MVIAKQKENDPEENMVTLLYSFSRLFLLFCLCVYHKNIEIICSSSVKNTIVILIGIAFNLQNTLGAMVVLTKLF